MGNTMKYMNGIEVRVGDIIAVSHGDQGDIEGVVIEVLLPDMPSAALGWSSARGGVVIEGGGLGLFTTAPLDDDEDIVFVRRADSKP
jgi:hypothetical protein